MKKISKNKKAVSEVVGVAILLGMAIGLFTVVQIMAINIDFNTPAPLVRLTATIDNDTIDGDSIILLHQGGESLSPDTRIIVVIDGKIDEKTVGQMLRVGDNSWNIGEKLLFYHKDFNVLTGENANITVVDVFTNSIIMQGTVRGGGV